MANLNRVTEAIQILEAATEDPDGSIHFVLGGLYRRRAGAADAASALQFFQNRRTPPSDGSTGLLRNAPLT